MKSSIPYTIYNGVSPVRIWHPPVTIKDETYLLKPHPNYLEIPTRSQGRYPSNFLKISTPPTFDILERLWTQMTAGVAVPNSGLATYCGVATESGVATR